MPADGDDRNVEIHEPRHELLRLQGCFYNNSIHHLDIHEDLIKVQKDQLVPHSLQLLLQHLGEVQEI
ncbi:hypothetical protein D3C73_1026300 [compost metagenome]